MPNIADYVKFDERSEIILRVNLDKKLDDLYEKHKGLTKSLPYLMEKEELLDYHETSMRSFKEKNLPFYSEKLLTQITIEWGEANEYIGPNSFSQASKEVFKYIASQDPDFTFIEDDDLGYVSLDEAKVMLLGFDKKLSDRFIKESLQILNRKEKTDTCAIKFSNDSCYVSDGTHRIMIPPEVIKLYILHLDKTWNESFLTEEEVLNKIKNQPIEEFYDEWA